MILSFLIMLYEYGIFPALLGMLWIGKEEKASFSKIYLRGYVTMLTLFWVVAVPLVRTGRSLTELTRIWDVIAILVIPVVIVVAVIQRKKAVAIAKELWGNIKFSRAKLGIVMAACVVATLFSMVIVLPSKEDDTTEHVAIAVDTDEMYRYAAYTKAPYNVIPEDKASSPIDMLYAVGVLNTGMNAASMIHVFLPLFLLPFFYAVSWQVGRYLFKNDLQKCSMFVVMVIIFSSAACYTNGFLAIGALQNIWNATTLLASCGIPAVMLQSFTLLDTVESRQKIRIKEVLLLIMMVVTAELMLAKGVLIAVLVIASCVGIFIIRKGMRYGKCINKH